jgi:hypothetical protein
VFFSPLRQGDYVVQVADKFLSDGLDAVCIYLVARKPAEFYTRIAEKALQRFEMRSRGMRSRALADVDCPNSDGLISYSPTAVIRFEPHQALPNRGP